MPLLMITFHGKCAQIIKNLLKQLKSLPHVASTTSTFMFWHWYLENVHGNGYILIPALDQGTPVQLIKTFICTIKEVYISCYAHLNNFCISKRKIQNTINVGFFGALEEQGMRIKSAPKFV